MIRRSASSSSPKKRPSFIASRLRSFGRAIAFVTGRVLRLIGSGIRSLWVARPRSRWYTLWPRRVALVVFLAHLAFMILTSTAILAYKIVDPPTTGIRLYRALGFGWKLQKRRNLKLVEVPKRARTMIIRVEDGAFYSHRGVQLSALRNARRLNEHIGRTVYGGSTITMQTARTLFLVPEKTYLRKYLEIIIALEMEVLLSKNRIFELYLNNAEWGKGVFGIEAAARHHYGRGIRNLTVDETIRLVTLLSSPIKYNPSTIHKNGILKARYEYLESRFR